MKLCILELDRPSDTHLPAFGSYGDMFENWLSHAMPQAEFIRIAIDKGQALPPVASYDGYLVTGCRYGVYDDIPWLGDLKQFLRDARDTDIPLGGVCFGHQIMADTFGADVGKSDKGWVVGPDTYADRAAFAVHQDQVHSKPDGAKFVSGSPQCPFGRIDYAFRAISIQYHPEFTTDYIKAFLDEWRGKPIPEKLVDMALNNLGATLNRDRLAADFASVFQTHPTS